MTKSSLNLKSRFRLQHLTALNHPTKELRLSIAVFNLDFRINPLKIAKSVLLGRIRPERRKFSTISCSNQVCQWRSLMLMISSTSSKWIFRSFRTLKILQVMTSQKRKTCITGCLRNFWASEPNGVWPFSWRTPQRKRSNMPKRCLWLRPATRWWSPCACQ